MFRNSISIKRQQIVTFCGLRMLNYRINQISMARRNLYKKKIRLNHKSFGKNTTRLLFKIWLSLVSHHHRC